VIDLAHRAEMIGEMHHNPDHSVLLSFTERRQVLHGSAPPIDFFLERIEKILPFFA